MSTSVPIGVLNHACGWLITTLYWIGLLLTIRECPTQCLLTWSYHDGVKAVQRDWLNYARVCRFPRTTPPSPPPPEWRVFGAQENITRECQLYFRSCCDIPWISCLFLDLDFMLLFIVMWSRFLCCFFGLWSVPFWIVISSCFFGLWSIPFRILILCCFFGLWSVPFWILILSRSLLLMMICLVLNPNICLAFGSWSCLVPPMISRFVLFLFWFRATWWSGAKLVVGRRDGASSPKETWNTTTLDRWGRLFAIFSVRFDWVLTVTCLQNLISVRKSTSSAWSPCRRWQNRLIEL